MFEDTKMSKLDFVKERCKISKNILTENPSVRKRMKATFEAAAQTNKKFIINLRESLIYLL